MELRQVRLTDAAVGPLLAGLTAEYENRYGSGDEMAMVDAEEFEPPAGAFVVVVEGAVTVAGGGFRRLSEGVCEVKRMWTSDRYRRQGHAGRVLTALEDRARESGYGLLRLETGPAQPEALAFYQGRGYRRIPVYGRYRAAIAFERDLVPANEAP